MEPKDNVRQLKYTQPEDDFLSDEFFQPTQSVWDNIEQGIAKKPKRRFPFFWIFFLSGFILAGGIAFVSYYNYNNAENQLQAVNNQTPDLKATSSVVGLAEIGNSSSPTVEKQTTHEKENDSGKIKIADTPPKKSIYSKKNEAIAKKPERNLVKSASVVSIQTNNARANTDEIFNASNNENLSQDFPLKNINLHVNDSALTIAPEIISIDYLDRKNQIELNFQQKSKKNAEYILESVPVIVHKSKSIKLLRPLSKNPPILLGFSYAFTPRSVIKKKLGVDLSETIERAYFEPSHSFALYKVRPVHKRWSVSSGIEFTQNELYTDYDLNIPYDLKTEKAISAEEANNSFYHSLPTFQGNVGTSLTVKRSQQDPITHNELIHVNLETKLRSKLISFPLALNFHLNSSLRGLYAGASFIPELEFDRNIGLVQAHSFHTYVKEKSLMLDVEEKSAIFRMGFGITAGYRLPVFDAWRLDLQAEYRRNKFNDEFQPFWQARATILRLF